jgi:hypothetical protein
VGCDQCLGVRKVFVAGAGLVRAFSTNEGLWRVAVYSRAMRTPGETAR